MKFQSLQPFIPSGPDMDRSKALFLALGFTLTWDGVDYCGFDRDGCKFILQKFDYREFAENLMITINVDDVNAYRNELLEKNVGETFGIRFTDINQQPYGKEMNLIDLAGVCWHFVES